MKYNIWVSGYYATGMEGIPAKAELVASEVEGETFDDAVKNWINSISEEELKNRGGYSYHDGKHFLWALQLCPTEKDANKLFDRWSDNMNTYKQQKILDSLKSKVIH